MESLMKISLLCVAFYVCLEAAPQLSEDLPHYLPLSDQGRYDLYWNYDESSIVFEVHVNTKGWVGLGLSKTGGMKDADIFIGWVKDGKAYIQDRYSYSDNALPKMDRQSQDWILLEGSENDTHTILRVKRNLTNCDAEDVDITMDTVKLIWAYHPRVEPGHQDEDPPYHGSDSRGTRSVQLLSSKKLNPELPNDSKVIKFLNPSVGVPSTDTTYWCQGFSVPSEVKDKKYHVVKVAPVIEEKNRAYVHHILLYACYHQLDPQNSASWDVLHGEGGVCYSGAMPTDSCTSVLFAWAVGEEEFNYPDHVGFPFGGSEEKALFLRMETHYDNPGLKLDIVDSSGLALYLTPTLREYDAGLMEIGLMPTSLHMIPPDTEDFLSMAYCPNSCIQGPVSNSTHGDIKFIAGFLHTHLVGTHIRLRHFRNGQELEPIYTDENYDFNFQEVRLLNKEKIVKPTDELVLECQYNTGGRTSITEGGISTREEMCLAYMQYYPRTQLNDCQSLPTMLQTLSFLEEDIQVEWKEGRPYYEITSPVKFKGKSHKQIMNEVSWEKSELKEAFQRAVYEGQHNVHCKGPSFNEWNEVTIPEYIKPMERPVTCKDCLDCGNSASRAIIFSPVLLLISYIFA